MSRAEAIGAAFSTPHWLLELMTSQLALATAEVFSAFEIELVPAASGVELAPAGGGRALAATIEYAGDGIRGALTLVAEETTVRSWLSLYDLQNADTRDAIGEFTNMTLGGLKSRVLREGVVFCVSTPTVAAGSLQTLVPLGASAFHAAAAQDRRFWQRLHVELDPNFAPQPVTGETPIEPGEALLF